MRIQSLGWEDPLGEEMAAHSSAFAWEISWTEEPGGCSSRGCKRIRHDLANRQPTTTSFTVLQTQGNACD